MARKLTQEEFESKVFDIFGDEYTVLGKYVTRKTEILVKHNKCGDEYYVNPNNLLQGKGHFKCNGNLTKTTKQFKQEVLELFNGEYEVLGEYKNNRIKIQMKHNKCGNIYLQIPKDILNGHGCPYCGGTKKITHFEYELKFNEVNNGEYELVGKYNGMGKKLCIKHKKCGNVFEMRSVDFLNGQRCPNCRYENTTKTHNEFIEEVKNIHGDNFEILEEYENSYTKIKIKCNKCGVIYKKVPSGLLRGYGCLNCTPINVSKGTIKIEKYLKENNLKYKKEFVFNDCKHKGFLRFDFAILNNGNVDCLIEFDGEQHYRNTNFFGGLEYLNDLKIKDNIKNNYCKGKGIKLIRIPFNKENKIEEILNNELGLN